MKRTNIIIATLAIGLAASSLMAQNDQRPRRQRPGTQEGQPGEGPGLKHKMLPPPLVGALDANHDGAISAEEIANASAALKTLDKNGDGQLTIEELRPPRPEGQGPGPGRDGERKGPPQGPPPGGRGEGNFHPPVPPMIGALDANGDKTISADEIANASNALKKLDKNGDGQLTMEELRPERPPRGDK